VGDIFGAPLAAEGVFAFFLESAFVGLILFGRDRVSSTVRWIAGLLVAFGTLLSAFWILVANSFMQTPAGYTCSPDPACGPTTTKLVLSNFWAAVFNPSTLPRFFHTVSACYVAGAFFLVGVAAFYLLRQRHLDVARPMMTMGIIVAFLGSGAMFASGDLQTREVAQYQPLKFAAMEGLCKTESNVGLAVFGLPPSQDCTTPAQSFDIPDGLSLMINFDPNATVTGLDQQSDHSLWPPVATTFIGFHTMVGIGGLMLLLMTFGAFFLWRRSVESHKWWLRAAMFAIPLPLAAIEIGWMVAEVGRQPWIVQGLMLTSKGVSPGVTATDVGISIIGIVLLYALLFGLWLYSLRKEIIRGPEAGPDAAAPAVAAVALTAAGGN
jgi:cytochrome d ubiquinol oxidase subunit I